MLSSLLVCLPQFLAMVFQDLLTNKDDYLRASRALLREIIKQTKHEINFQAFCLGLMQERKEPQYLDMEFKVGAPPAARRSLSAPRARVCRGRSRGRRAPSCEDPGGAGCGVGTDGSGWAGQLGDGDCADQVCSG